jgi:Xaa-Pro aminopeptidase
MRLKEFQKYLREEKINFVFLLTPDINVTYFTQIKPTFAFLTFTPNTASFYPSSLDKFPKLGHIKIKKIVKGWDKKLSKYNYSKIGINKSTITVLFFEKLKKMFPKAKFVDVGEKLKELRAQKIPLEIKNIKKACQITDQAYSSLLEKLRKKKLKTEQEVMLELESVMHKNGALPAFSTIAACGKNSTIPHHTTSKDKLKRGFLLLDFGACYNNYCADMSRVIFLGKPTKQEIEMYDLLLESQECTIKKIKEMLKFSDLDKFCRKKLGGKSSHFIHSLGHGVGLEIHESPNVSLESKDIIRKGNVFTIEPGIYFPKKYGLRIEDTVLFDKKVQILTKSSKELPIINI